MTIVADLHVHTQASDGLFVPAEVVAKGKQKGLLAIAITDHDTVDGINEALAAAVQADIKVIPGIELSTEYQNHEIHILGFCVDHKHPQLLSLLETLHESRFNRAEKMVQKLKKLGYEVTMQEVLAQAKDAAPGRPHVARVLVEKGYYANVSDVFNKLLGFKMPGYVERFKLTPPKAIEVITKAGGISAWAHPGLAGNDGLLAEFIAYGLKGMEAYHPDHNEEQARHYRKLAQENGMFITGGSDFHGQNGSHARDLGYCGLNHRDFKQFQSQCKPLL